MSMNSDSTVLISMTKQLIQNQ